MPPWLVPWLTVRYGRTHAGDAWVCGVCGAALGLDPVAAHAHLAGHVTAARRAHRPLRVRL